MVDILKQKGQVFLRLDYIMKGIKKKKEKKTKKDGDHLTPRDYMDCINIVSCQSLKSSRYGPKHLNIHEMMT